MLRRLNLLLIYRLFTTFVDESFEAIQTFLYLRRKQAKTIIVKRLAIWKRFVCFAI